MATYDHLLERIEALETWAREGLDMFTASDDPQAREVNMIRWLRRAPRPCDNCGRPGFPPKT